VGFTGLVAPPPFPADPRPVVPAAAYWHGRRELREDRRSSLRLVAALALSGLPAGLLWWLLAPRADFRVTEDGPVVIGNPSQELLVGDDVVYVLVLGGLGLIAGALAWRLRRRRGVATVLALALGALVAGVLAWQVGELLGHGPSKAQLADVGTQVTTALHLAGLAALAVPPFAAVLAYLVPVLVARGDDLGRVPAGDPLAGLAPHPAASDGAGPAGDARDLVDAPPSGWPQA
jgi:hypothetical protein